MTSHPQAITAGLACDHGGAEPAQPCPAVQPSPLSLSRGQSPAAGAAAAYPPGEVRRLPERLPVARRPWRPARDGYLPAGVGPRPQGRAHARRVRIAAGPLARRPYDLRHAWLNVGVVARTGRRVGRAQRRGAAAHLHPLPRQPARHHHAQDHARASRPYPVPAGHRSHAGSISFPWGTNRWPKGGSRSAGADRLRWRLPCAGEAQQAEQPSCKRAIKEALSWRFITVEAKFGTY